MKKATIEVLEEGELNLVLLPRANTLYEDTKMEKKWAVVFLRQKKKHSNMQENIKNLNKKCG